jgi:hypothetical protein
MREDSKGIIRLLCGGIGAQASVGQVGEAKGRGVVIGHGERDGQLG